MGAPGAGKGTQADRLEKALGYQHISTGDVLRREIASGSELGKQIAAVIDRGDLISDEMMVSILKQVIAQTQQPILLDGFPRTVVQAEMLNRMMEQVGRQLKKVIAIVLPEETVIARLSARKQCRLPSGEVKQIGPDFSLEMCQVQKGEIFSRPDDTPEHVSRRLEVYHKQTAPVADFYKKMGLYVEINGNKTPDEVFNALMRVIEA